MELHRLMSGDLLKLNGGELALVEEITETADGLMTLRLAPADGRPPWTTAPMSPSARIQGTVRRPTG